MIVKGESNPPFQQFEIELNEKDRLNLVKLSMEFIGLDDDLDPDITEKLSNY